MTKISSLLEKLQKPILSIEVLTFSRSDGEAEQKVSRYENHGVRPLSTAEERIVKELALRHFEKLGNKIYNFSIYGEQNDTRYF